VTWSETFLAAIALATLLMAFVQVAAIVAILGVVRKVQGTLSDLQRDVKPLLAKASVAAVQAQKIDRLVTDLAKRVDDTAGVVQQAIITPAREGMAIIAALKAGLAALQGFRERPRHPRTADEEDPLFIG
jgi:hypothetical protein